MRQVSTQAELQAAIMAGEKEIEVTADFNIDALQEIAYATTIASAEGGSHTLTKADGYNESLFAVINNGSLTLQNIVLDGAKGAHASTGGAAALVTVRSGTLILDTDSVLQNNNSYVGGAVSCETSEGLPCTVTVQGNAAIRDNYAALEGGGICVKFTVPGSSLQILDQALIENNRSDGAGGGIYYSSDLQGSCAIGGNVKVTGNHAGSGSGGGVYVSGRAAFTQNAQVSQNTAENGGGLYFTGSSLLLEDGVEFSANQTGGSGGGAYLYLEGAASADVAIHGAFDTNVAGAGGGVYMDSINNGTLNFARARFERNRSTDSAKGGGGLYIRNRTETTITPSLLLEGTEFTGNKAVGNGGGIFITDSRFENHAPFSLQMRGSVLMGNEAASGGGLYAVVQYGAGLLLQQAHFYTNSAARGGGVFGTAEGDSQGAISIKNVLLSGNTASVNGGAIDLGAGDLAVTLEGVVMEENTATANGGGLYNAEGTGSVTLLGATRLKKNAANSGSGGGIYQDSARVLRLQNAGLEGDTAQLGGQGVYSANQLELGPSVQASDGFFILNRNTLPSITAHLTSDSVVQLEGSDYVAPNPAGTPILVARSDLTLTAEDAAVFRAPVPDFDGWGPQLSEDGHQVVLAPLEYTIQYKNTMGVENPNPLSYTALTAAITLANLADTADYRFTGWFDAPEGGERVTEIPQGSTGDRILYARWEEIRPTLYLLTYEPNDAGGPAAQGIPGQREIPEGETAELSAATPTRTGYRFSGWNTTPDGTGMAYQPGQTTGPFYADLTIYAQWRQVWHTLTYHGNDEAGPPAQWIPFPQPAPEGQVILLSEAVPTREGYRFIGWNTRPDAGGTPYIPGGSFGPIFSDADLYAQWIPLPPVSHTLAYCGNDAGGPPACGIPCAQPVPDGQCARVPFCAPYRACYCFTNWNTDPCGRGRTVCPGQAIGPVTGDICLYAQWRRLPPKPCDFCRRG